MSKSNASINGIIGLALGTIIIGMGFAIAQTPMPGKPSIASQARENVGTYDIRDYGAVGDGKTLNTAAIQSAIDACTKNNGGIVAVPPGDFVTGTIELKSNVTLYLADTAHILGSTDIGDYTEGKGIPAGNGNVVLIYAAGAENIAIEGRGIVDGQGEKFLPGAKDDGERTAGRLRAHLVIFHKCKNLSVRDTFFKNSSYHCMRILRSSGVKLDGVRIHNRVIFNNDGFHFNNCEHVKISNCNIVCEDDACALFGGNRDVTVTNCTFSSRWSVFRFGGGVSENITVSNCVINDTFGCPIKMQVGRGTRLENMIFSDLVMNNVTGPIYIGLGSSPRNSLNPTETREGGIVRNIAFRGIRATVAAAPDLTEYPYLPGTPISDIYPGEHHTCINLTSVDGQFVENITLSDVHVTFAGGGTAEEAALRKVPQMSGAEYFAGGVMPAYGLFARNVKGLTLDNVRFTVAKPDLRPALVFDHVVDAAVDNLSVQGDPQAESVLRLIDSQDVLISSARLLTPAAVFLQVEGSANKNIKVNDGDLSKAVKELSFTRGAEPAAATLRE